MYVIPIPNRKRFAESFFAVYFISDFKKTNLTCKYISSQSPLNAFYNCVNAVKTKTAFVLS